MMKPQHKARRGSVVVVVIWAIAIAALVTSAVQLTAYRQAVLGRETLGRIQARWAARGGVEQNISVMAYHTELPDPDRAWWALVNDLFYAADGETFDATWSISHFAQDKEWGGPFDEHSKFNINREDFTTEMIDILENMTIDIAAEIVDWIDPDDTVTMFGAERDFYLSQSPPYQPRNGPLRTTAELELVAGIWPEILRGEDWNLNNRLDANENDSDMSFPYDDPDDILDAGWYAYLTSYSVVGGATASGLPRLYLRRSTPEELMERIEDLDLQQAQALKSFGSDNNNSLESLVFSSGQGNTGGGSGSGGSGSGGAGTDPALSTLTDDQLRAVLDELTVDDPVARLPGKMNINTISRDFLRDLLPNEEILADEILYLRDSRPEGITNMLDLLEIKELGQATWERLSTMMTTTSNVYTITSRGRSLSTGLEVEIVAVVDRSTIPVRIIEYREQ